MDIPDYLYKQFPSFKKSYNNIQIHLKTLEQCKLNKLFPKQNNIILTRVVYLFAIYNQIVLHRVIDLSKSIIHAWKNKYSLRNLYCRGRFRHS